MWFPREAGEQVWSWLIWIISAGSEAPGLSQSVWDLPCAVTAGDGRPARDGG